MYWQGRGLAIIWGTVAANEGRTEENDEYPESGWFEVGVERGIPKIKNVLRHLAPIIVHEFWWKSV